MSRYKDSNKYKIYGEDAILVARFDKYLDATLHNCRADYLKALSKRKQREIPYLLRKGYFGYDSVSNAVRYLYVLVTVASGV